MQRTLTEDEATAMDAEHIEAGQKVSIDGGQWTVGAVLHKSGNGQSEYVLALEEVA